MDKKEAVIHLQNGQRRYGSIIDDQQTGQVSFLSFLNEQLYGTDKFRDHLETIAEEDIYEIDLCMK